MRTDSDWAALASLEEERERTSQMGERFRSLLALPEEERRARLEAMIRAEYELPDKELRDFTRSRLRSWIALGEEDREAAKSLGKGYDDVFETLPANTAMRRATIVQTIASHDLTLAEMDALFSIIPGLARQVEQKRPPMRTAAPEALEASAAALAAKRARPFWARLWPRRDAGTAPIE
jgi:hypothetical protein